MPPVLQFHLPTCSCPFERPRDRSLPVRRNVPPKHITKVLLSCPSAFSVRSDPGVPTTDYYEQRFDALSIFCPVRVTLC